MSYHGCINGTVDGAKYSSPVPIIGLYIAAASSVCMLLMFYDIVGGFRARKRWLPCKLLTLNSVTLTLLSVAAKLTVDLTTSMPSSQDQLSKLSGTTFICISMGIFSPSLGLYSDSENLTNMVALSIFVITVIVNICMQIFTGVIVLFLKEHIIVLCCMMLLLMVSWYSTLYITYGKRDSSRYKLLDKFRWTQGGTLFTRLQKCYMHCYSSNPQFVMCKHPINITISVLCLMCSFVLIQAAIRSLVLKQMKFCYGNSDYEWSMPAIVFTQILTVLVGTFAISFRWLKMIGHMELHWIFQYQEYHLKSSTPILGFVPTPDAFRWRFQAYIERPLIVLQLLIIFLPMIMVYILDCDYVNKKEWTQRKSSEEMNRCMKVSKSQSLNHLCQLLLKTHPSQQLTRKLRYQDDPNQCGINVSPLSVVVLVRIAEVSLPSRLTGSLLQAFPEANEIIQFIEKTTTNPEDVINTSRLILAKAVWVGKDFSCLLDTCKYDSIQSELDRAILIITELKNVSPTLPTIGVLCEVETIVDFINRKTYSSTENLYTAIEQLFVDMMHAYLVELPIAIFQSLNECASEELEDRVKFALELLCKIVSLEGHIQWSFPAECNIRSLITEALTANAQNNILAEEITVSVDLDDHVTDDLHNSVSTTSDDVIIELDE